MHHLHVESRFAQCRQWISDRLITIGFYVSVIAILGVGSLAYYLMARSAESEAWVVHTHEAIEKIEELHQTVVSAESTGCAFLISGRPALRTEFGELLKSVDTQLYDFKEVTAYSPIQREANDRLNQNIGRRFAYLGALVVVRGEKD
jgi:CHASE3 domain sensor protein